MNKNIRRFLLVAIFLLTQNCNSYGYNDIVHKVITESSVKRSSITPVLQNLGYSKGIESTIAWTIDEVSIKRKITEWIQEGGVHEDDSLDECKPEQTRAVNHFHDATKSWGQAFFDDDVNKTYIENYGQDPVSALLWGLDYNLDKDDVGNDVRISVQDFEKNTTGDWSWVKARDFYYASLVSEQASQRETQFAESLRALGQVTLRWTLLSRQ